MFTIEIFDSFKSIWIFLLPILSCLIQYFHFIFTKLFNPFSQIVC